MIYYHFTFIRHFKEQDHISTPTDGQEHKEPLEGEAQWLQTTPDPPKDIGGVKQGGSLRDRGQQHHHQTTSLCTERDDRGAGHKPRHHGRRRLWFGVSWRSNADHSDLFDHILIVTPLFLSLVSGSNETSIWVFSLKDAEWTGAGLNQFLCPY